MFETNEEGVHAINDIFTMPPIVLPKVRLSEIIELLRDRVNKHYMPSSNGKVEYNSKPEYDRFFHPVYTDMPDIHPVVDQSGYYCLDRGMGQKMPIFFNLNIGPFQIVINLTTEKAIIRRNDSSLGHTEPYVEWQDSDEQTIPLLPSELKETIDIYG